MDQINALNRMSSTNREQSMERSDLQSSLKNAITDLKEEIQGVKRGKNIEKPSTPDETKDTKADLKEAFSKNAQTRIQDSSQNQLKADMAAKRQGNIEVPTEDVAEAFAGILAEDDIKKKKKGDKTSFEQKLERFEKMEEVFKDVEFADPQQAQALQEFFDNIGRLKNLKSMFKQLLFLEGRLEEEEDKKKLQKKREVEEKERRKNQQEDKGLTKPQPKPLYPSYPLSGPSGLAG